MELVSDSLPQEGNLHLFPAFLLFFLGVHMEEDQDKPPGDGLTKGPEARDKAEETKNRTGIQA